MSTREITRARKAADEARSQAVEQLKQVRYFWKQAHWLTERFPEARLRERGRAGQAGDNKRTRSQRLEPHLRFPGHEHAKIKNDVPEGREKKPPGDVAPLKYGKALKKDVRIPGPFPVYGSSGVVGTHSETLVEGPAIIVGSVYWSNSDFFPIDTVYFIEAKNCTFYLY